MHYWNVLANRKSFFEEFATTNNFDALVPRNWYSISKKQIIAHVCILQITNKNRDSVAFLSPLFLNINIKKIEGSWLVTLLQWIIY